MNKQTAVEWIVEQLQAPCRGIPSHIIDHAKQMEKEQIMNSFVDGGYVDTNLERQSSEQYFEELYGK